MDYPFDTSLTAYAYVTASIDHYSEPYGHLRLILRLPALQPKWGSDSIDIVVSAQCSRPDEGSNRGPEFFYAQRMLASQHTDGISLAGCQLAAREMQRIERAIEKINVQAGAPAVFLEDWFMRILNAAKVTHCYAPEQVNDANRGYTGRSIPDLPHYVPSNYSALHSQLRHLKTLTLKRCGHFPDAVPIAA